MSPLLNLIAIVGVILLGAKGLYWLMNEAEIVWFRISWRVKAWWRRRHYRRYEQRLALYRARLETFQRVHRRSVEWAARGHLQRIK